MSVTGIINFRYLDTTNCMKFMINWGVDTRGFNLIDKLIAYDRLSVVKKTIKSGDIVLDFGCGYQAYLLKYFGDKIKSGVGIDYDVENKKIDNLEFISFTFKDILPFSNRYFNKIVMLAVLEHIEIDQVDILFKEFVRVLNNGGEIVLTTPTKFGKFILETLAYLRVVSREEIGDHKKYYTLKNLEELAKKSKLKLCSYKLFQFGINSAAVFKKI